MPEIKIRYWYSGGGEYEPDLESIADALDGEVLSRDVVMRAVHDDFMEFMSHGDPSTADTETDAGGLFREIRDAIMAVRNKRAAE